MKTNAVVTRPVAGFSVESSDSGNTVMVRSTESITLHVRGETARRLKELSDATGRPVPLLIEEVVERSLGLS